MKKAMCLILVIIVFTIYTDSAFANSVDNDIQEILDEYSLFIYETGLYPETKGKSMANAYYAYAHAYRVFLEEYDAGRIKSINLQSALKFLVGKDEYGDRAWGKNKIDEYMQSYGDSGSRKEALDQLLTQKYIDQSGNAVDGYSAFVLVENTVWFGENYIVYNDDGTITLKSMNNIVMYAICGKWGGLSYKIFYATIWAYKQYDIGD